MLPELHFHYLLTYISSEAVNIIFKSVMQNLEQHIIAVGLWYECEITRRVWQCAYHYY